MGPVTDEALDAHLQELLEPREERRVLLTAKYGQLPRLNLALLRFMLERKGRRGAYISIDRPHKYAELLLRRNKIPHEQLTFVDMVTRNEGGRSADTKSMLSAGGFFWLKLLSGSYPHIFAPGSETPVALNMDTQDFLLLDNVAILPAYNSEPAIREYFLELANLLDARPRLRAYLVTHSEIHAGLMEIIEGFSDIVLDIGGEW